MMYRLVLIILCIAMSSVSIAAESKDSGKYIAIATAKTMNNLKTVGAYVDWMSAFVPKDQLASTKKLFAKWGLKNEDKLPHFKAKKNRVFWDGHYIQFDNNYIVINGKKFAASGQNLDQLMMKICNSLGCVKDRNFSLFDSLFINKAEAIAPLALFGIGAAVGGLATWLFTRNASASENTTSSHFSGSNILDQFLSNTVQIGTYYIAQELLGIGSNGYYECQNGRVYAVGRNGQILNLFNQSGNRIAVPTNLLNASQTCEQNASAINESIRINANNGRVTPPTGSQRVEDSGAPEGAVKISN